MSNENRLCLNCLTPLIKKPSSQKFCGCRCAAIYNNKVSQKLALYRSQKKVERYCLFCGKTIKSEKFCSRSCKSKHYRSGQITRWLSGELSGTCKYGHEHFVKIYLLTKNNNKCSQCGWGERNPKTGNIPLEVDHIDGNAYNNSPENVRLLCPNCQSLTPTYRGANAGNGRRTYLKKYYIKAINNE